MLEINTQRMGRVTLPFCSVLFCSVEFCGRLIPPRCGYVQARRIPHLARPIPHLALPNLARAPGRTTARATNGSAKAKRTISRACGFWRGGARGAQSLWRAGQSPVGPTAWEGQAAGDEKGHPPVMTDAPLVSTGSTKR
jgi:hypothetical protein